MYRLIESNYRKSRYKSNTSGRLTHFVYIGKVLLFVYAGYALFSLLSRRPFDHSECSRLARWLEIDSNETTTAYPPIFQFSNALVVKVADEKYSQSFLPDYSACRIIIGKVCNGLMDCASFKLKALEAIQHTGTLDRSSVIVCDYDAIILGRTLTDGKTYSALPGHRSWSTSLMGFGKYTNILNGTRKASSIYIETLRDDVAFRAVRVKPPNKDIQPTFHARGKAWPTKDPILAFVISIITRISVTSFLVSASEKRLKVIKIGILLLIGFLPTIATHHIIRFFSAQYYVVPDDSACTWISLPLIGISMMIDKKAFVLRHDLYGPFITDIGALIAGIISISEEIGLITIFVCLFIRKYEKRSRKLIKNDFLHNTTLTRSLGNAMAFLIIIGCIFMSMVSSVGLSVRGGLWNQHVHCSKVKCRELTEKDMSQFFKLMSVYVFFPALKWSFMLLCSSSILKSRNMRLSIFVGTTVLAILRCHYVSKRSFSGNSFPSLERTLETKTINGSQLTFKVKIPIPIEKVETMKINVGSGRFVEFKSGDCMVHPNWHKVVWMNAICFEKRRPKSIIFYDDDVELTHFRDYMNLGLVKGTDATLVEDPHVPGQIVSYLGRFNLQNCSLVAEWLRRMPCGIYRTLNDQPVLNKILNENSFIVKRVRIPVFHRDRGTKGFGIKPRIRPWIVTAVSAILMMLGQPNRFDPIGELVFHGMMAYIGGQHLNEVRLHRTMASPYEAVRDIEESKRTVEAGPMLYTIFDDYTGKAAELHFSLWAFLKSTTILFLSTNAIRFCISLITGIFFISAMDLATALVGETKSIIQLSHFSRLIQVHCLATSKAGSYKIVRSENDLKVSVVKRKDVIMQCY